MQNSGQSINSGKLRWFATLSVVYLLILGASFAYTYVPRYLKELGWSGTAIGLVLGMHTILRSVAMPAWARLSDSSHAGSSLVKVQFGLAALPLLAFPWVRADWLIIACVAAFALTLGTSLPLLDTIVVRELSTRAFGRVRAWGSAGYGLTAAAFGLLGLTMTHVEIANSSPWFFAGLSLLAGVFILAMPRSRARLEPFDWAGIKALAKNRWLIAFFLVWAIHWMTQIPYNLFLVFLCEARGFDGWVPGACVALAITAEVAVLAMGGRIVGRIGPSRVLAFTILVTGLRWALTWMSTDPLFTILLQSLHGFSFGAFFLSVMNVLDHESPTNVRASAQAALYVVVFGAGSATGQLISGWWVEHFDSISLFGAAAVTEGVLLVFAIPLAIGYRRRAE